MKGAYPEIREQGQKDFIFKDISVIWTSVGIIKVKVVNVITIVQCCSASMKHDYFCFIDALPIHSSHIISYQLYYSSSLTFISRSRARDLVDTEYIIIDAFDYCFLTCTACRTAFSKQEARTLLSVLHDHPFSSRKWNRSTKRHLQQGRIKPAFNHKKNINVFWNILTIRKIIIPKTKTELLCVSARRNLEEI